MTKNKRYTYLNYSRDGYIGSFYENDKPLTTKEVWDILNEQKKEIEYLETKIKENEWHWNTIDEDRDVWHYKCNQAEEKVKELKDENKELKKDSEKYRKLTIQFDNRSKELIEENEQLKQDIKCLEEKIKEDKWNWEDKFICLDCEYGGYAEIGCLCEKQDHWEEFKSECNDFEKLKY